MAHPDDSQMVLALQVANGYGSQPGAWRFPGVDPFSYTDMDVLVRYAQAAERGKIQLIFLADTPALDVDLESQAPHHAVDPLVALTSMARGTQRIGLVATSSTTLNEPFTIARQFKALDVASRGRAGWNAVPTSHPAAAANYGMTLPSRQEKYERAHEVIQVVQALWGSWGPRRGCAMWKASALPTCLRSLLCGVRRVPCDASGALDRTVRTVRTVRT